MSFLYPNLLYLLIIPGVLALIAFFLMRGRSEKWKVLISPVYRAELLRAPSPWRRILPIVFGLLATVFLILACARPIDGYTEKEEMPESHNILIAIDCSRSMLVKDVTPSRLDRAKTAAYDLLDALPEDNFGIIIFSGDAVLLMPITHDHSALKETIDQLQYGWVSQGGTNLENVVRLALNTFRRDQAQDSKNALVILSDGEDTTDLTNKTAEAARKSGLIIVTAGIGSTNGAAIPDSTHPSGLYHNRRGESIISKLVPENLQLLANQTDGQYIQLSAGASLNHFVKEVSERLDVTQNKAELRKVPNDRFIIFAVPALICLILALLAGTQWRSFRRRKMGRKIPHVTALFLLGFLLFGVQAHGENVELHHISNLLQSGNQAESLKKINELLVAPNLSEDARQALEFAKGCLEEGNGNTQAAAEAFSQALLSPDEQVQTESHFQLGNIEATKAGNVFKTEETKEEGQATKPASLDDQIKEIDALLAKIPTAQNHVTESVKRFDDALRTRGHEGANENKERMLQYSKDLDEYRKKLEELKKKLEEQKQQQQQNQQNQDQQNQDQQNKDQQNQDQQNKDQQNKDQQNKDQQNKDQQNKDQQNKDQQNKDQQNKDQQDKDQQNKDQQNKDQQNKDQQNKDQQNKDQQNKDQQNKDQQNKDQQDKDQQGKDQDHKEGDQDMKNARLPENPDQDQVPAQPKEQEQKAGAEQEQQGAKELPVATQQESREEKERREARAILQDKRDIEPGCPIPQRERDYTPAKDY